MTKSRGILSARHQWTPLQLEALRAWYPHINSAKVEVEYAKATSGKCSSGFLPSPQDVNPPKPGMTMHRLRG